MTRTTMQIWGAPLLLAVLTTIGLVSALLGDGIWDALAWVGLGIPAILGIRPVLLRR